MSNSLQPCGLWPTRLLCPWNSPGKNTGVGSPSLLQGIFLIQGSNLVSCIAGRFFSTWATVILNQCHCLVVPQCMLHLRYAYFLREQIKCTFLKDCVYWPSSYLLVMYATRVYALSFTLHRKHTHKFHRTVNQSFLWLPLTLYIFLLVLHCSHLSKLMLSSWYTTHEFINLPTERFHYNG